MVKPIVALAVLALLVIWLRLESGSPPVPPFADDDPSGQTTPADVGLRPPTVEDANPASPEAKPRAEANADASPQAPRTSSLPAFLPDEARATLERIGEGGPFPYRQDGQTFHNRERRLPMKPKGFYREYTVDTPGLSHRGARRIVTGGDPPTVYYYTGDHYETFRRFEFP